MARFEEILRTPPLVVTAVYFAGELFAPPSRTFSGVGWTITAAPALSVGALVFVFVLVWNYVLYEACIARLPAQRRMGRLVFIAGFCGMMLTFALSQFVYVWSGPPPNSLLALFAATLAVTMILYLAQIVMSADAIGEFAAAGPVRSKWILRFAILGLGIGIWFIHRRIADMLFKPRLADQPS